jgi:hypothetical protein
MTKGYNIAVKKYGPHSDTGIAISNLDRPHPSVTNLSQFQCCLEVLQRADPRPVPTGLMNWEFKVSSRKHKGRKKDNVEHTSVLADRHCLSPDACCFL